MNLICLYGPPASGKLTIAEELSAKTGFKLFHNHLTQDLAREIYPDFGSQRFSLVSRLRLDVFEYAAENDTDLIFTFVYSGDEDDKQFIANTIETVTKHNGNVHFVRINAPIETLLERVANESREKYHKLKDADILRTSLSRYDMNAEVENTSTLAVDTSTTEPHDAVEKIITHFHLV